MSEPPRGRGRPRILDREEGLRVAARLFWTHGYEGTSISDLTRAMGITPPSLYAAFGSKEQLYREAVDYTAERENRASFEVLFGDGPAYEAIAFYLHEAADRFTDPAKPRGCMVSTANLQHGEDAAAVARLATERRAETMRLFKERLDRAVDDGELRAGTDTEALSRFFGAVVQGMSAQSCDGASAENLHRLADVALSAWPR